MLRDGAAQIREFRKIRGPFLGVPLARILVYYSGLPKVGTCM